MQTDKELAIYIGVTDNCDAATVNEINKCCELLSSKNSNGGKLLLVTENNINYPLAVYLINTIEGDVLLTRYDKAFNIKLGSSNALSDVLHALTASWFLANLVGHDYADYVSCLEISKSLQLDTIDISHVNELVPILSGHSKGKLPTAVICYIEAVEKNITYEWFGELGAILQQYNTDETRCVVTMSSKPIQQIKNKIHLTWFY